MKNAATAFVKADENEKSANIKFQFLRIQRM
jgi:hypothetical protein